MNEAKKDARPRRDVEGRITALPDLIGTALAGVVIGVLALVVFDAALALTGLGDFGRANGWLAVILPAWLFVEEFRAWGFGAARILAAIAAVAGGLVAGLLAAGVTPGASPLWTGAVGAGVFALAYALIWFFGVRWSAARTG